MLSQDGAICHTANYTKKYLEELGVNACQNSSDSPNFNRLGYFQTVNSKSKP